MKEPVPVEVNTAEVELDPIANGQTVVHFSKVDADTAEELPGAVLELYAPDGTLLDTWETSPTSPTSSRACPWARGTS